MNTNCGENVVKMSLKYVALSLNYYHFIISHYKGLQGVLPMLMFVTNSMTISFLAPAPKTCCLRVQGMMIKLSRPIHI